MIMNTPEIKELIRIVEDKYGRHLKTTTDFEEFSLVLQRTFQIHISASTLKRLWGYVKDIRKPRGNTLDLLSSYIGHPSFDAFVNDLKTSHRYNSSFFTAQQLSSSELAPGAELEIGWSPNRLLRLRYVGESTYEVLEASNSKLLPGDRFVTGCFFRDIPLYLPYIIRGSERTSPFIAGRNGGLTCINIIKK